MSRQDIDIGDAPNDHSGDPLRTAFQKCNENFIELYAGAGLPNNSITLPQIQTIATDSFLGRDTPGTGNVEVLSAATARQILGLSAIATSGSATDLTGSLNVSQLPALTGDVTSAAGSNNVSINNGVITFAKMANATGGSKLVGRGSSGSGTFQEITLGQGLSMSGTTLTANGVGLTGAASVVPNKGALTAVTPVSTGDFALVSSDDAGLFRAELKAAHNADTIAYDTNKGVYVNSVSSPHVWVKYSDYIRPEDFGAHDSVNNTDHVLIQAALDMAAKTGRRVLQTRPLDTSHPVYVPSNIIWEGRDTDTYITNHRLGTVDAERITLQIGEWNNEYSALTSATAVDVSGQVYNNNPASPWYTLVSALIGAAVGYQILDRLAAFFHDPDDCEFNSGMNGRHPNRWQNIDQYYPFYSTSNVGTAPTLYQQKFPKYAANAARAADTRVTFVTASHSSFFTPGQTIYLRSNEFHYGRKGHNPHYAMWNVVVAVGTGYIDLLYPLVRDVPNLNVMVPDGTINFTNGLAHTSSANWTKGQLGERPIYVCKNTIIDGIGVRSDNGSPLDRSAMVGCTLNLPETKGLVGLDVNAATFCNINVDRVISDRQLFEVGGNSVSTQVSGDMYYTNTTRSTTKLGGRYRSSIGVIRVGENSTECTIKAHTVSVQGYSRTNKGIIELKAADGCKFEVENLITPEPRGFIVHWHCRKRGRHRDPNETQHNVINNFLNIGRGIVMLASAAIGFRNYLNTWDDAKTLRKNRIEGRFDGPAPQNGIAAYFGGDSNECYCEFESGAIDVSDATDYVADVTLNTGYDFLNFDSLKTRRAFRNKEKVIAVPAVTTPTPPSSGQPMIFTPTLDDTTESGRKAYFEKVVMTSAVGFQINQISGGAKPNGTSYTLRIYNGNTSGAITPSFHASYGTVTGGAIQSRSGLDAGQYKYSEYKFTYVTILGWMLQSAKTNLTGKF